MRQTTRKTISLVNTLLEMHPSGESRVSQMEAPTAEVLALTYYANFPEIYVKMNEIRLKEKHASLVLTSSFGSVQCLMETILR